MLAMTTVELQPLDAMHGGEADALRLRRVDGPRFECDVRQIMLRQRDRDGVALPPQSSGGSQAAPHPVSVTAMASRSRCVRQRHRPP